MARLVRWLLTGCPAAETNGMSGGLLDKVRNAGRIRGPYRKLLLCAMLRFAIFPILIIK
jgi:hypothetical protein